MAAELVAKPNRARELHLTAFDPQYAGRVVSWVRGLRETYWLAPRTKPPLTADKVRAWAGVGRHPLMLILPAEDAPLAYGELNVLNERRRTYWLGHLIVDPKRRGEGLGRCLTEMLLHRAFRLHAARRVSLVVFPENRVAVACYRAAGMHDDGSETHFFPAYRCRVRLLRLAATRAPEGRPPAEPRTCWNRDARGSGS
jgi:RimJ/RimL family protein N-acetyltransferase